MGQAKIQDPILRQKLRRERVLMNATRACDVCKRKKIRCDGSQPCGKCAYNNAECSYNAKYTRGKTLSPRRTPLISCFGGSGHSSSDESFILTKQRKYLSDGGPRWFVEMSVGDLNSKYLCLPSKGFEGKLLGAYFTNASPTYRIVHRPLIESWMNQGFHADSMTVDPDFLDSPSSRLWYSQHEYNKRNELLGNHAVCAVMFSIFAVGCHSLVDNQDDSTSASTIVGQVDYISNHSKTYNSLSNTRTQILQYHAQQFFIVAYNELQACQRMPADILILQAQYIMSQYLIETGRIREGWELTLSMCKVVKRLHLHCRSSEAGLERLDVELRRRALWSVYTFQTYLTIILGQEVGWNVDHITADYPIIRSAIQRQTDAQGNSIMDISELSSSAVTVPNLMFAPNAHAKLARLLRQAMEKFHHIAFHDTDVQDNVIDEVANELDKWDADLPQFLRHNGTAGSPLLPPYLQQYELIQFARVHARLLIYRPSLDMFIPTTLAAYESDAVAQLDTPAVNAKFQPVSTRRHAHRNACLQSAIDTAQLTEFSNLNGSHWLVSYVVFCALTVIFVYLSLHPNARNQKIFEAARRLCEFEQRLACTSDMAKRYMTILKIFWEKLREQVNKSDTAINANGDRMRQNNDASKSNDGLPMRDSSSVGAAPSYVMTVSQVDLNDNSSPVANRDGISDGVQDKARGEADSNSAPATDSGLDIWSFENWDIGLGFPSVEGKVDIYGLHTLPAADSNGTSKNVYLHGCGSGIQSPTELQSLTGSHLGEMAAECDLQSLLQEFQPVDFSEMLSEEILDSLALSFRE
ncbi:hypothetical protein V1525DRAFT_412622 [Lipomyces kononenkoae]|uniref:Uncharacterized protein n=1 Tax=Lipomyces kononenkoae TaxID=34357 RepID=A0ACC3SSK8_LIPKO